MTYTFTKAMGGQIGLSICEDDKLDLARELMQKAKDKGVNLVLAVDAKIADAFSNDANTKFCPVNEIPDGWEGLDIGPKSEEIFAEVIKNSKTILWNGPTGVFEFENFTHGSRSVGEAIVEATKNGAFSLVWRWRLCSLCQQVRSGKRCILCFYRRWSTARKQSKEKVLPVLPLSRNKTEVNHYKTEKGNPARSCLF